MGEVIKLEPRTRKGRGGSRSGRHSTRGVYEQPAVREDEGDPSGSNPRPVLRLLPRLDKERSPGMATDYSCRLGPRAIARIKLEARAADHAWIDWVYVPPGHRGDGAGQRLMAQVLADADTLGVRLSLEPRSCAGLEQGQLEGWYARLGFLPTLDRGDFGTIWVRSPVGVRRQAA